MQVPLLYAVDVLVFGAQSGAVAAALAAAESGKSVVAISDRPYFGEETAGAMQLWPATRSQDPLFVAAFGRDSETPPSPGKVKRVLESALLQHGVPFLYECRPVFLLRAQDGGVAGVILAARSALYAVTCRVAVDTSRTGILARLAGLTLRRADTPLSRSLVALGTQPPQTGAFSWEEVERPFLLQNGEKTESLRAYRLSVQVREPRTSLISQLTADFSDRTRIHYPGMTYSADAWSDVTSERLVGSLLPAADNPLDLPDQALSYCNHRLVVANALLPLTSHGAATLNELACQVELGRRAGRLAASYAAEMPPVTGELTAATGSDGPPADSRFATPFLRPQDTGRFVDVQLPGLPVFTDCEVLVAGGGTSGAPAGIAAARTGARTIVVERLHGLGGVGTLGLIASYYMGNRVGFTAELDAGLAAQSTSATPKDSRRWNPEEKMGWYLRALQDAGGSAWLGSFVFGVHMQGSRVEGALVSTPYGAGLVCAGAFVDATGNADVAAAAGAPCREIGPHHVAIQGAGLSPRRPGTHYRNSDHNFIDDCDPIGVTHAYVNARAKFPNEFDVSPLVDSRERRQIVGEIELSPLDFLSGRTFKDTIVTASSNFDTHGFTVHPVFMVVPPDRTGGISETL